MIDVRYRIHKAKDPGGSYQVKCEECGCTALLHKRVGNKIGVFQADEVKAAGARNELVQYTCPNCMAAGEGRIKG